MSRPHPVFPVRIESSPRISQFAGNPRGACHPSVRWRGPARLRHHALRRGGYPAAPHLYFFDLAGIALFAIDPVAGFFARSLHTTLWTGQASIVFPAAETENNSSHIFFKLPVSPLPRSSIFIWLGVGGGLGLTLYRAHDLDISVGAGTDAKARWVDPVTGEEHA